MSIFLGIDIGTSGTKTLAIDHRGGILASALETYPCYFPKPLWSEQDPEDWWQATVASVRKVVKKAKLKPGDHTRLIDQAVAGFVQGKTDVSKVSRN